MSEHAEHLVALAKALLEPTKNRKVCWRFNGVDSFKLPLANGEYIIGRAKEINFREYNYQLMAKDQDGQVVADFSTEFGDPSYIDAKELYLAAQAAQRTAEVILNEMVAAIN